MAQSEPNSNDAQTTRLLDGQMIPPQFTPSDSDDISYRTEIQLGAERVEREVAVARWDERWQVVVDGPDIDSKRIIDSCPTREVAERVALGEMFRIAREETNSDPTTVSVQTLRELLEYTFQNRPDEWGGLSDAVVESKTTLFDDVVAVDRSALETLVMWAESDSGLESFSYTSQLKTAIRDARRAAFDFDSEQTAIGRDNLTTLLRFVKDDPSLDSAPTDASILDAIRQISADIDHDDPLCGRWKADEQQDGDA